MEKEGVFCGKKSSQSLCGSFFSDRPPLGKKFVKFLDERGFLAYNKKSAYLQKKYAKPMRRRCSTHENDIPTEKKTEIQSTRLQKKNGNCQRQKSSGSQKKKRQKSVVRIRCSRKKVKKEGKSGVCFLEKAPAFACFLLLKNGKAKHDKGPQFVAFSHFQKEG